MDTDRHGRERRPEGAETFTVAQEYGADIDGHDCILRFNIAPTKGFETNVGKKTTIRFVNRLHFGFREAPEETVLQHVTMPDMMMKYVAMMKKRPKMPTYPFDMSFYEQVEGLVYACCWHQLLAEPGADLAPDDRLATGAATNQRILRDEAGAAPL